jgi:hypothetical protein
VEVFSLFDEKADADSLPEPEGFFSNHIIFLFYLIAGTSQLIRESLAQPGSRGFFFYTIYWPTIRPNSTSMEVAQKRTNKPTAANCHHIHKPILGLKEHVHELNQRI